MGCVCNKATNNDKSVDIDSSVPVQNHIDGLEPQSNPQKQQFAEKEYDSSVLDKRMSDSKLINMEFDSKSDIERIKSQLKREKEQFRVNLLREFNECRVDPKSYAKKIENHIQYIKQNPEPKESSVFLYDREGGPKISLAEGVYKFRECIDFLNKLKPMPPLEHSDQLIVKVPKSVNKWSNKEVFSELLGEKKAELSNSLKGIQFQFDIGWNDPEVCAIMQIVDDNYSFKGSRRNNILNKGLKLVGISNQKNGKKNCTYILFARNQNE